MTTAAPSLVQPLTERTLALAIAGDSIHQITAQRLITRSREPRSLALLLDRSAVKRSATRKHHVLTRGVVEYLTAHSSHLSLFDLLRDKTSSLPRLQSREVISVQAQITTGCRRHGLPRVLLRQPRVPPVTPIWEHWYQGERETARRQMRAVERRTRTHDRNVSRLAPLKAQQTRVVWVAPVPSTSYAHYLHELLGHRVEAGQQVHVLDAPVVTALERDHLLPDIEVYGSGVILTRHYTDLGFPAGVTLLEDLELALGLIAVIDLLNSAARPLSDYSLGPVEGGR